MPDRAPQTLESLAVPDLTDQERDDFLAAIFDDEPGSPLDRLAEWAEDRSVDRYREVQIRAYAATDKEPGGVGVRLYAQAPAKAGRIIASAYRDTATEAARDVFDSAAESPSGVTR